MHMTHNNFTYKELLTFGWEKTKQHYWFLLGVAFIYLVLTVATGPVIPLNVVAAFVLKIAVIYVALRIVDDHTPKYADLVVPFRDYKILLHFVIGSILYALAVIVGLLLLVLPGIYLLVRLQYYSYLLVEHENMTAMDALRKSMDMTRGKFWKLFGFLLVFILINIVGALLLGIGLFITLPMTTIAYTLLYRKLSVSAPRQHEPHNGQQQHEEARHIATE